MRLHHTILIALVILTTQTPANAQKGVLPPGNKMPFLRLQANGPTSPVTSVVFAPDGKTLYTAGADKVVRVWRSTPNGFALDRTKLYRIPIGPGIFGVINTLAISPDGEWMAVGGAGVIRNVTGLGKGGKVWPVVGFVDEEMKQDHGLIYVIHLQTKKTIVLKGHRGAVQSLAFHAPNSKTLMLVSAATWRQGSSAESSFGEVIAWNVLAQKQIARAPRLPFPPVRPPALSVLSTGPSVDQTRVVIGWGDGKMRVWRLAQPNDFLADVGVGQINNVLCPPTQRGTIVGTSFVNKKNAGVITLWDAGGAVPNAKKVLSLPPEPMLDNVYIWYPRAMTLISDRAGGPLSHAAIIMETPVMEKRGGKWVVVNRHVRLHVYNLRSNANFGNRVADVKLWNVNPYRQTIHSVQGGRFVAVGGNNNHQIHIYSVADLLKNRKRFTVLRSSGEPMRFVRFCTKTVGGKTRHGIKLSPSADGNDARILDLAQNRLTNVMAGWKNQRADQGKWQVTATANNVTIRHGNNKPIALQWPKGQTVTSTALTATSPVKIPLLAVAVANAGTGEQYIDIYHAEKGVQIRRLVGHVGPIHDIAFSADGMLLASASADQTIAVWSVLDLAHVWQRHGRWAGFSVQRNPQKKLVIRRFAGIVDASPVAKQIASGSILEGISTKNGVKAFAKPTDVYDYFWMQAPGDVVRLSIRDSNNIVSTVAVPVAQAIDDRQPLFSLFVTRPQKGQVQQWVGWNSVGTYDSSRAAADKLLNWHFNTGNVKTPTDFASLNKYRKEGMTFHRSGILKYLVERGSLSEAIKRWDVDNAPMPSLRLRISVDSKEQTIVRGHALVRKPLVQLKLTVDNYTPGIGDVVEWQQFVKGKWQVLKKQPADTFVSTNLRLPLRSQSMDFQAVVRLRRDWKSEVHFPFTIHHQLPAPTVKYDGRDSHTVNKETYRFQAQVKPAAAKVPVTVALQHLHYDEKTNKYVGIPAKTWNIQDDLNIDETFKLKVGKNVFRLIARNKNPLANREKAETVAREYTVFYVKKPKQKLPPPDIAIQKIITLLPSKEKETAKTVIPGQAVTVDVYKARIVGTITAKQPLTQAVWDNGNGTPPTKLANLQPKKEIPIDEEIVLRKIGPQIIRLRAKSNDSPWSEKSVTVVYQPQLPELEIISPKEETVFQQPVKVEGKLFAPPTPSPYPFQLQLAFTSGNAKGPMLTVKGDAKTFSATKVPLEPKKQLQITLAHKNADWGKSILIQHPVPYVRPPQFTKVTAERFAKKALANISATVKSHTPLDKSSVKIKVNGEDRRSKTIAIKPGGAPLTWEMTLSEVTLSEGDNVIAVWVSNEEWQSLRPGTVKVNVPAAPKPPTIDLVSPAKENIVLEQPELQIKFRVHSKTPLTLVELTRKGETLYRETAAKLAQRKANAQDYYAFTLPKLELPEGEHLLHLVVRNDGGQDDRTYVVTSPPRGVKVVIDALEIRKPNVQKIKPKQQDGKVVFPKMPTKFVRLYGRVRFPRAPSAKQKQIQRVHLYVNSFRQLPVRLQPVANNPQEKTFEANLLLNATTNDIEIFLPQLVESPDSQLLFKVRCAKPAEKQRLYLVVLAPKLRNVPAPKDDLPLQEKILKGLRAKKVGKYYQSEMFDKITVVPLTNRFIRRMEVEGTLDEIEQDIYDRARDGSPRDLVLLSYQGIRTITNEDIYLWTSEIRPETVKNAVSLAQLNRRFSRRLAGAQIMFLDVTPRSESTKADNITWMTDFIQKHGQMRYAAFGHNHNGPLGKGWAKLHNQLPKQIQQSTDIHELQTRLDKSVQVDRPDSFDRRVPEQMRVRFKQK